MKFFLAWVALASLVTAAPAGGSRRCSLSLKPIEKFDADEFVFTGKVAETVGPLKSKRSGEVWGVLVDVDEKVHAPASLGARAEVFPYHLGADCSDVPWDKQELARFFPPGAKVRVIAVRSRVFKEPAADGAVRLDVYLYDRGDLARNALDGAQMTSASTVYEYADFKKPEGEQTDENEPLMDARWSLPEFELRKDLLRLRRADSEAARVQVLERLAAYPGEHNVDFAAIARGFVKDAQALAGLLKKREEAVALRRPAS
ncbi:MAG: hypothetical protein LC800_03235 [Acidobacteria bacterium]|nr:hypothetical protein [Acidobacteriota bacterium]